MAPYTSTTMQPAQDSRRWCFWKGRLASARRDWPANLWAGQRHKGPMCCAARRLKAVGGCPISHSSRPCGPESSRKMRSEEHTSELQSQSNLVCRLLLEKKKKTLKRYI